ncbi:hypothetical protein PC129_g6312 [Phytophthora cactorum]|uniref:Uncharacterized protein n=2 Tax=Phytophthora cactorum TaxID=29920 RepID=A0A329R878_9STRA|nr:hypothetical protein Pcac1_g3372 [Phytophthora cactorum]KAG2912414.1 hypothetical protein PC114_g8916 [Phytophthora cactorum]KAG2945119.1 hypothetical protein PC117_g8735 [Phytophthora cactorum]KAG2986741.1 hypothetical protein PC118_g7672 [Phytophthora cactorum]KAG3024636.1 hypothetical protein PC119_g8409 [Phytophthora cactorum]
MQNAPCKRLFSQFLTTRHTAANVGDVEELSLVELVEAGEDHKPLEDAQQSAVSRSVPGAQAYVNRLLVRVKQFADQKQVKLTHGLTSHSFRRGATMHANDGSLAENWNIERGGWQLDRVNKAFGYMLGTTQADQNVARVLSGWRPKEDPRLPSLRALEYPVLARAEKLQALLFTNTLGFADHAMNLDEDVAKVLTATLTLHYLDMLVLSPDSAIVARVRDATSARAIGEAEVLAWSDTIRRAFTPPPEISKTSDSESHSAEVLSIGKRQSEQISVLILQNKLAVETKLHPPLDTGSRSGQIDAAPSATSQPEATHESQHSSQTLRQTVCPKKKGSQSLSAVWYEWFTAEPRVHASRSVKKTTLYEFRHTAWYMMLFLPSGFALDAASSAFKSEVLSLGEKAQENT